MALFSATTVDEMIKSFPTHNIVPIEGRPTYREVKPLIKGINQCAQSVPSLQPKGHLYLTTTNSEFHKSTGGWKLIPTNPPTTPLLPAGATQYQIAQANRDHDKLTRVYHLHQVTSEALKKVVTENIDSIYLGGNDNSSATILDIITHLKDKYYKISNLEVMKNDIEIRKEWDIDTPIEKYFQKVKVCRELAEDANEDYTNKQIIQIMFTQMQKIKAFKSNNREWKRKSATDKTIENFRTHYIEAYEEMLENFSEAEQEQQQEAHNIMPKDLIDAILQQAQKDDDEEPPEKIAANTTNGNEMTEMLKKILQQLAGNTNGNSAEKSGGRNNDPRKGKGKMAWRKIEPAKGEAQTKMFEGVEYKFCGKCQGGKGFWTKGEGKHGTDQHDPSKRKKE